MATVALLTMPLPHSFTQLLASPFLFRHRSFLCAIPEDLHLCCLDRGFLCSFGFSGFLVGDVGGDGGGSGIGAGDDGWARRHPMGYGAEGGEGCTWGRVGAGGGEREGGVVARLRVRMRVGGTEKGVDGSDGSSSGGAAGARSRGDLSVSGSLSAVAVGHGVACGFGDALSGTVLHAGALSVHCSGSSVVLSDVV